MNELSALSEHVHMDSCSIRAVSTTGGSACANAARLAFNPI